jgi:hypothetical protein
VLRRSKSSLHHNLAARSHGAEAVASTPATSDLVASLVSAWTDGEARPTHRKQPTSRHWWKTRVNPFPDVWPVVERWSIAEHVISFKASMQRLATLVPDGYASKARPRTLQRRVKA